MDNNIVMGVSAETPIFLVRTITTRSVCAAYFTIEDANAMMPLIEKTIKEECEIIGTTLYSYRGY
jgi:hypothetical protein